MITSAELHGPHLLTHLRRGWGHELKAGDRVATGLDGKLLEAFPEDSAQLQLCAVVEAFDTMFGRLVRLEDGTKLTFLGDPDEGFAGDEVAVLYVPAARPTYQTIF